MSDSASQPVLARSTTAHTASGATTPKRRRWWRWLVPQFSLRFLLVSITALCLLLGSWISRAERQRAACKQLNELSWNYSFDENIWTDFEEDLGLRPASDSTFWERTSRLLFEGEALHYWHSVKSVGGEGSHCAEAVDLLGQLPSLRSLAITDQLAPLHGDAWEKIGRLTSLRELDLSQTAIDDAGMMHIARLRNLRKLTLSNTVIGNEGAKHLSRLTALEELNLAETNIGDDGLAALAGLTRLKNLDLTKTPITGAGVRHLAGLKSMRIISLGGTRIDDRIGPVIAGMKQLLEFDATDTDITDAAGATMFASPSLETIFLGGTKVGSPTLAAIAKLPKISVVHLWWTSLKPGDVSLFNNSKTLNTIYLPLGTSFDEVTALRHLPALGLVYVHTNKLTREHLDALDGVCDGGGSLEFNLSHCRLGREGWAKLAASRNVTVLRADHSDLDDESLAKLTEIPTLNQLWMEGCPITDEGLATIAKCKLLSKLDLSNCPITDAGLEHLSSLEFLENLFLTDCHGVTNAGLRYLAPIQITELDLCGTAVTDAGLKGFPSPHELNLHRTAVTADGIFGLTQQQRLRHAYLPGTTISSSDLPSAVRRQLARGDLKYLRFSKQLPFSEFREKLSSRHQTVTHLSLSGQSLTNDDVNILDQFVRLEHLTFLETPLSSAVCRWIGTRPALTSIEIGGVAISDEAADVLSQSGIAELELSDTEIGVDLLRKLTAAPNISKIVLTRSPLSETHLDVLASCGERLKSLELSGTGLPAIAMRKRLDHFTEADYIEWEGQQLSREQLQWMIAMQKDDPSHFAVMKRGMLRELSVGNKAFGCSFGWYGPAHKEATAISPLVTDFMASRYLSQGRDAQDVDIAGSEAGSATMRELAQFRWLISLDLSKTAVRDEHLQCEKDWTQLRTFNAANSQLGDEGIEQLADCWRLTKVDLDHTLITDRSFKTLGQMRFLESLSLVGTKITDEGLQSLYGLKHLERLWLNDTLVTPQGLAELQRRLPQCDINGVKHKPWNLTSLIGMNWERKGYRLVVDN